MRGEGRVLWPDRRLPHGRQDDLRPVHVGYLRNTIALRHPTGTVVHSDRGSQLGLRAYVQMLARNRLRGSMGRVAACACNAAMESFFSLLQKNVLNRKRWATRHELRLAIITWIERTYHRRRRQRTLGQPHPDRV